MKTILLVEDNETIRKGLDYLFIQNDLLLLPAENLKKAREYINTKNYDLIILDVTLPDGDGFLFYEEIKENIHVPVIFLTAKDLEDDIVHGLELGAVDYIVKPFRNRELILRINNALKFASDDTKTMHLKDLEIELDSMQVKRNGVVIPLTTLEYKIFIYMLENRGKVITREALMDKIWDLSGNDVNDNTITVYIKRIREKLGSDDYIKTIKGIGYRVDKE